ncbi:hypothetical protein NMG60_11000492 [Bertholletia excelsa]
MLSLIYSQRKSLRIHRYFLCPIQILLSFHSLPSQAAPFSAKPSKPNSRHDPNSPKPASKSVPQSNSFPKTENTNQEAVLATLSGYSNDWNRAFEFFNWVVAEYGFEHSTETYNRLIDILGKFFEFDLAWNAIEQMRKSSYSMPNHNTFRILFKRYVSAHLVEEAISTYNRTEEFNLKDELSFCNLIDALCEYKHVIEAEEMCLGKHLCADTKIYNMILRGWSKMRWWGKCSEFWEEMDKRRVHKDLYSYSIYMDIMCKRGKPWKAVELYKEMKKKGIQLDVVAYNTVLQAMGRSEGVDFSIRLYREMKELGVEPNVVTCNTIIKLLCENGRIAEAYKVLDQMRVRGCAPNVITYHSIFGYLEKPKDIFKLFDRMKITGVRPTMDTYVMLMRKFGRWGFLRPVFFLWEKMEEHGLSPDGHAYNALIDALIQKGMVDMARKYDEEMLAKGLSAKPRAELGAKLVSEGWKMVDSDDLK